MALRYLERRSFVDGEAIIKQGTEGHIAYIVESGEVEIVVTGPHGPHRVGTVDPGGIFGEMALIEPGQRSASALAIGPTTCILIYEPEFRAKIENIDPLVKALLRILVRNVRDSDKALSLIQEH
jgi:CRP-like cAMP-binding protein